MAGFKSIYAPKADIVDRAKEYRKHENGCKTCRDARYRHRPWEHRCRKGQMLWEVVFGYEE